jgi:hypothetical protein
MLSSRSRSLISSQSRSSGQSSEAGQVPVGRAGGESRRMRCDTARADGRAPRGRRDGRLAAQRPRLDGDRRDRARRRRCRRLKGGSHHEHGRQRDSGRRRRFRPGRRTGATDLTGQVAVVPAPAAASGRRSQFAWAGSAQASSSTTRVTHQAPPKRSRRSRLRAPGRSTSERTCQSLLRSRRSSTRRAAGSAASTSSWRTSTSTRASALCWTSPKPITTACTTSMPRARPPRHAQPARPH